MRGCKYVGEGVLVLGNDRTAQSCRSDWHVLCGSMYVGRYVGM